MNKLIRFSIICVGVLAFSSLALAQPVQMQITGDSYGTIGPYTGQVVTGGSLSGTGISGGTQIFQGSIICDDTATTINVPYSWNAQGYTVQQAAQSGDGLYAADTYMGHNSLEMYEAAAYLAGELLSSPGNADLQDAIWNIMNNNTDPATQTAGELADISAALAQAGNGTTGYTGAGWTVYTPQPNPPGTSSQEFFVYTATPEPVAAAVLGVNVLMGLGLLLFRRRRSVETAA